MQGIYFQKPFILFRALYTQIQLNTLLEIEYALRQGKNLIHMFEKRFLAGISQVEVEEPVIDGGVQKFPGLQHGAIL